MNERVRTTIKVIGKIFCICFALAIRSLGKHFSLPPIANEIKNDIISPETHNRMPT